MVKNFGDIALACAIGREKKYTDSLITQAAGLYENQTGWMVRAGRDGTLRNVLEVSESIEAFCMFMEADPRVRMQAIRLAIESGGYLNQKSIEVARRVVLARAPRTKNTTNAGMQGGL